VQNSGVHQPEGRNSLAQARKPWVGVRKDNERRRCGTSQKDFKDSGILGMPKDI
jgi:hypothetical protein